MNNPRISAIAAIGKETRVLGKDNQLLWHLPEDLRHFKEITRGHPVIMGRKTFESVLAILGKPLPGRTNIVITRQDDYKIPEHGSVEILRSIDAAIRRASSIDTEEIFIIGGAQIYEAALKHTDRLYLTLVDSDKDGDTYFPAYEDTFTKEIERETHETEQGLRYTWLTIDR